MGSKRRSEGGRGEKGRGKGVGIDRRAKRWE